MAYFLFKKKKIHNHKEDAKFCQKVAEQSVNLPERIIQNRKELSQNKSGSLFSPQIPETSNNFAWQHYFHLLSRRHYFHLLSWRH